MEHVLLESTPRPHVLVIPYPSQGHINPLLQFAKRLASKGVKATLATTHYTVESICATNVAVEPISDGFDLAGFAQAQNEDTYLTSFKENGSKTLSQLIQKYQETDFPISCIVYDSFLAWALDVAKDRGIHAASFFTNSAAVSAIYVHIHGGTVALPVDTKDGPLILPSLPPLYGCDLPGYTKSPESCAAYLAMLMNQFSNLEMADFVFANTFEALEGKEAKSVAKSWKAKLIGPMVPSAYLDGIIGGDKGYGASLWKPLSDQCTSWLKTKQQQSVIYVSLGSMVALSPVQMEEMACALMDSNSYFVWIVRETERNKLPAGFVDSIQEKGLIVSWCNQLEVLAHPSIGCFVTHCGWNSTLEGLSVGVPMVAIPRWSDQMTDAKFIEEIWEVGVRAKEDEFGLVRREELLFCLKEVMAGGRSEELRRNARKWRALAKEAMAEGGSSDSSIDEFVEQLKIANKNALPKRSEE